MLEEHPVCSREYLLNYVTYYIFGERDKTNGILCGRLISLQLNIIKNVFFNNNVSLKANFKFQTINLTLCFLIIEEPTLSGAYAVSFPFNV